SELGIGCIIGEAFDQESFLALLSDLDRGLNESKNECPISLIELFCGELFASTSYSTDGLAGDGLRLSPIDSRLFVSRKLLKIFRRPLGDHDVLLEGDSSG